MIHTTYSLTLRNYARYDETGDESFLCTWPLWIAKRLNRRRLEALKDNIIQILSATFKQDLRKASQQLIAYNKIIAMQAVLSALKFHYTTKIELDIAAGRKSVPTESELQLIEAANMLFDVQIKDIQDIQPLFDTLQFKIDKYAETYKKDKTDKEPMSFLASAQQIFVFLEQDYNGDLSIAEFANLRKLALEKSAQIEKQLEEIKNR